MMPITSIGLREEAEKQEHVTDSDAVVGEVALRGPGLTERASAGLEHGIVVAVAFCGKSTARNLLNDVAQI